MYVCMNRSGFSLINLFAAPKEGKGGISIVNSRKDLNNVFSVISEFYADFTASYILLIKPSNTDKKQKPEETRLELGGGVIVNVSYP